MYSQSTKNFLGCLLGAAATAACIFLLLPPAPSPCGVLPADQESIVRNGTQADPSMKKLFTAGISADDKLLEVLKRAAMDDKTIIMTFTNDAWTAPGSLLDLFLQSFRLGVRTAPLLKHLVVVAVDAKAYERCQHVHPLCYHFRVEGVDYTAEQSYMQKDYLDMMWRRNRFQARILQLGYSFVFTFVETAYLSGFCDLRKDFYKVCTVHANCLVGLKSKLQKLTEVFGEWKQFREKAALLGSNTTALTD